MLRAVELFEQAVSLDPTFSKAWSGMAFTYSLITGYSKAISTKEVWNNVKAASDKAIRFDPNNAEAFAAQARANIDDDYKTKLRLFEKAYELAPNNADVVNLYADFMVVLGDFGIAERLEQKAIDLDPLAAVHYSDMAFVLNPLHRHEEALVYGRTSANLEPDSVTRSDPLVSSLTWLGQYDEAIEVIRHFEQQADPDENLISLWWCQLYYTQGDEQKLREVVAERMTHLGTDTGHYDLTITALFVAWLDGTDAALPLLEKAYEIQEFNLTWPEFFYLPEDISDDPKWLAFWQQPPLDELMDIRRRNKTQERIGWWRDRPEQ